jgi:hypothetical protein
VSRRDSAQFAKKSDNTFHPAGKFGQTKLAEAAGFLSRDEDEVRDMAEALSLKGAAGLGGGVSCTEVADTCRSSENAARTRGSIPPLWYISADARYRWATEAIDQRVVAGSSNNRNYAYLLTIFTVLA